VNELQARIRPALAAINSNAAKEHDGQANRLRDLITQRAVSLERQITTPEPKPLAFDSNGEARIGGWQTQLDSGMTVLDKANNAGKEALHIRATGQGIAS